MSKEKPKFTPGPWSASRKMVVDGLYGNTSPTSFPQWAIAVCYEGRTRDKGVAEANARLIATTPELLESEEKNLDLLLGIHKKFMEIWGLVQNDEDVRRALNVISPVEMAVLTKNFNANMAFLEQRILETDALLKKAKGETDEQS